VLQEFTGWHTTAGRYVCTLLTLAPPLYLVLQTMTDPVTGSPVPAWRVFWTLFGTANQMLAALTLLGVTVWLLRTGRTWWYTAVPAAFMILVTLTSLGMFLWRWVSGLLSSAKFDPNGPLSTVLFGLAILLVIEAVVVIRRNLLSPATAISSA
jgi:carbon starvation protein